MKKVYKGYEIEVKREMCLGGWSQLYFTIYRIADGQEMECSFEDSAETVREKVKHMVARIDNEHAEDDPWGEKAEAARYG